MKFLGQVKYSGGKKIFLILPKSSDGRTGNIYFKPLYIHHLGIIFENRRSLLTKIQCEEFLQFLSQEFPDKELGEGSDLPSWDLDWQWLQWEQLHWEWEWRQWSDLNQWQERWGMAGHQCCQLCQVQESQLEIESIFIISLLFVRIRNLRQNPYSIWSILTLLAETRTTVARKTNNFIFDATFPDQKQKLMPCIELLYYLKHSDITFLDKKI